MKDKSVSTKTESQGDRLVVSLEYAAWRLSVSPSFLRLEIARGNLHPVRLGRRILISEAEIDRYVATNTKAGHGSDDQK
jgi:excisionase family DNA binding protein